ncbi:Uncharacterized protein FWK35_00032598, partial [Aphis craccivora]
MDTSYSIVHFFDDKTVEKKNGSKKEFKLLKTRVLSKGIKTLEHARKLAEEARYRSDFSADESFIDKASNNQYSPTLSNSSITLYEGIELVL